MKTFKLFMALALVAGLALVVGPAAVVLAGTFGPITVIDQTPTAPLANPVPSSFQPRFISGFGSDNSFTVFFEDRDAGYTISYSSSTSGPTGFPASATASNIMDTNFVVKDWPINIGGTDYAYRAWGSVGNNMDHHFYVSNDLTNWTLVSTFTIPNAPGFTNAHGWVYYGFHDVIELNCTYYAFAESNQSQTMIVRSANGDDVWEAFASVGGRPGDGPLELPSGVTFGWTPSGSFVDLGHDRGYGKIHVDPRDSNFYLALNTAAKASLSPANLEAAFINPANWTWHDGTTGPAANPILSATGEHDLRECWLVPNSDPDADWVIVYDADFGAADGGKALGYATLAPPTPQCTTDCYVDDAAGSDANGGTSWSDAKKTIGAAASQADSGGTVHVIAGTYVEQVTLSPGKNLTFAGQGRDVVTWIAPANGQCIVGNMSGYTGTMSYEIYGFTFNGRSDPAAAWGVGVMIYRAYDGPLSLSIYDNRFIEDLASADSDHWSTSMFLCHNRFAARDGAGNAAVRVYNNIDETLGGITMSNSQAYDIYDNVFDGGSAIYNGHGCPDTAGQTFGDHHIYGNTFKNASDDLHPGALTPAIDWQYYGAGGGTHLPSVIEENDFVDNDTAIRFVMDTDMAYPAHVVRNNSFVGHGMAIRVDGTYASVLDASGNWWGTNDPAGVAAEVSGNVDYTPWLDSGDDISADPGFQGNFSALWVDDDSPQTGSTGYVQEGVDMVSGSTVYVAAGTYNGSVTIDVDNLTLIGDSNSRPNITSGLAFAANLTGLTLQNFYVTGAAASNSIVRMSGATTDLSVDNCVFDGENVSGRLGFSGGQLEGDVTVTNSEFKNILGWALFESKSGSGGDGSAMATVTFANNYIHDSNGSVVFRGLSTDRTDLVNVYGNTWENIGGANGELGQHWAALDLNRTVEANIYDNTVDSVSLGQWGEGQAFQFWNIDTLNVYDNNITNNAQGIFIYGDAGGSLGGPFAVPGGSISCNNIEGNAAYGLDLDPAATGGPLNAENNWWGAADGPGNVGPGSGDGVSANVDFDPWSLGTPPCIGTIVIEKQTEPDGSPQSFQFSTDYGNFTLADDETNNSGQLTPGIYSVSENVPANWSLTSATCSDGSPGNVGTGEATVNLAAGETVTCTFTNRQRGTITIVKDAIPDDRCDFTFDANSLGSFVLDDADPDDTDGISNTITFPNLPPATYTVTETVPFGWEVTTIVCDDGSPTQVPTGTASIDLAPGEVVTCTFTNKLLLDYGDAPDPNYPTLEANTGASHILGGTVYLGDCVDGEVNGQPSGDADGDDTALSNLTYGACVDGDEDGVTFTTPLRIGMTADIEVVASAVCDLSAWIDFNADGDWVDDGEEIFSGQELVADANSLSFEVPEGAVLSMTYARFRCTTDGAVPFTGQAPDGEVEDYQVRIACVADLDGNGGVNAADLSILLSQWGVCAGCLADLNGNGWVNLPDLSILVSQWGAALDLPVSWSISGRSVAPRGAGFPRRPHGCAGQEAKTRLRIEVLDLTGF